jgi:hypothetical protein
MMTDADRAIADAITEELADMGPMEVTVRPATVFQLTGLIQLAMRHPGVVGGVRATAEQFLAHVREYFADCPVTLDAIRRGDDPQEDRR